MTSAEQKPLRTGSSVKRASILAAARSLFLDEGYERTSVDAVAARARVSKRTVYDYYGDKRGLMVAVVDDTGRSLMESITNAIERYLVHVDDLESALVAFARQIATDTFGSSDYVLLRRLLSTEAIHLPDKTSYWLANAPDDALAKQFAVLTDAGRLHTPDSRLAAEHFTALTFLLAMNNAVPESPAAAERVEQAILDGVPAFLRAYAAKPQ